MPPSPDNADSPDELRDALAVSVDAWRTLRAEVRRLQPAERVAEAALAIQLDPGPYHSTETAARHYEFEQALDVWRPGWRNTPGYTDHA